MRTNGLYFVALATAFAVAHAQFGDVLGGLPGLPRLGGRQCPISSTYLLFQPPNFQPLAEACGA